MDELLGNQGGTLFTLVERYLAGDVRGALIPSQERLGLLQILTSRITSDFDSVASEYWPRVSSAFDEALEVSGLEDVECVIRRLNLMGFLLQRLGPRHDVRLLDPVGGLDVFLHAVPMDPSDAYRLSDQWQNRDIDTIRCLRVIKNMLTPMAAFVHLIPGEATKERLNEWIDLLPRLP